MSKTPCPSLKTGQHKHFYGRKQPTLPAREDDSVIYWPKTRPRIPPSRSLQKPAAQQPQPASVFSFTGTQPMPPRTGVVEWMPTHGSAKSEQPPPDDSSHDSHSLPDVRPEHRRVRFRDNLEIRTIEAENKGRRGFYPYCDQKRGETRRPDTCKQRATTALERTLDKFRQFLEPKREPSTSQQLNDNVCDSPPESQSDTGKSFVETRRAEDPELNHRPLNGHPSGVTIVNNITYQYNYQTIHYD